MLGRLCTAAAFAFFVTAAACGSVQDASTLPVDDAGTPATDAAQVDGGSLADAASDASVPQACGVRGVGPCATGTFCFREGNCGEADQPGVCIAAPTECGKNYNPVCGCDGLIYGNTCLAQQSEASVSHVGACLGVQDASQPSEAASGDGTACGGFAGLRCGANLFCLYPDNTCRTIADGMGTCTRAPDICQSVFAPVCGCDGQTYSNACDAYAHAQSVAASGACR